MKKSTERFTQTVSAYEKYRPNYPPQVLVTLIQECNLTDKNIIADIGSGTGLLTKLLLDNGNTVYGVEPNHAMRKAAERYLESYQRFISIDGTAENTTLSSQSIDLITVGTAFHWFNAEKTKKEFQRILQPNGWVLLVWNVRDEKSELIKQYDKLITVYGTDYSQTAASTFDKTATEEFFAPNSMHVKSFNHSQRFDWEGFQGRLFSASYCPTPDNPNFSPMMEQLKNIFDQYQTAGYVDFRYVTKLYYGHLHS